MSEPESVTRLRRAAAVLRESVDALPDFARGNYGSWHADHSFAVKTHGSWPLLEALGPGEVAHKVSAHVARTANPATVLALAAWLETEAKREAHSLAEFGYRVVPNEAHELARLVLREDEGSEG